MKIDSSNVALAADTKKSEARYKKETMQVATRNGALINIEREEGYIEDTVTISDEARTIINQNEANITTSIGQSGFSFDMNDYKSTQIEALTRMISMLTGKKLKFFTPSKMLQQSFTGEARRMEAQRMQMRLQGSMSGGGKSILGGGVVGINYQSTETRVEKETMNFAARGTVRTADGREIDFSASISMNREFVEKTNMSFQAGIMNAVDPLVINFDSAGTDLTETKFSFDLDCDGIEDSISFVGEGSGFLALDINGDGKINDGSELFGTQSGNGFADLAKYDDDGNGWIDENDAIYDKLRIWTKDKYGNDKLLALGVKGIGAIYLGSTQSDFTVKNSSNAALGQVRRTGIFLKENGEVGTIQHVDLMM